MPRQAHDEQSSFVEIPAPAEVPATRRRAAGRAKSA
jgi:hypothetical protein